MIRPAIHLILHFAGPALVARFGFREQRLRAWLIMVSTMLVDLDHLLADPVYDPGRCSIGFHPLHTGPAIIAYVLMTLYPRTRIAGIGLVIHMCLDIIDCIWMKWPW